MRKIMTLAGVAIAAVGFSVLTAGSASAAGCLNSDLTPMSLTHNEMVPNEGFRYDRQAHLDALAQGNGCGTTQQSFAPPDEGEPGYLAPSWADRM